MIAKVSSFVSLSNQAGVSPSNGVLRISELPALGKADIAAIQTCVSRRVLRWFVRRGWIDPDEARAMRNWHNDGGLSLDAGVHIPGWDHGLERLLRPPIL